MQPPERQKPSTQPRRQQSRRALKGAGEIFSDLSKVPTTQEGIPIASDRGSVEGLVLRARRMNIDGAEVYEVSGKLTQRDLGAGVENNQAQQCNRSAGI